MATETDIVEYHKGEYISLLFYSKDRLGNPTPSAATNAVVMTISENQSGTPLLTLTAASGNVVLNNATTAEYIIQMFENDLSLLIEGRTYYYNIWNWNTATPTVQTLQAKGRLVLLNSIEP